MPAARRHRGHRLGLAPTPSQRLPGLSREVRPLKGEHRWPRRAAVPSRSSTGPRTLPEDFEARHLANLLRLGTAALRECAVAALTAQTCGFPKHSPCPTVFFQIQARDEG